MSTEETPLSIPADVLGDDLINVRPLGASGGFSNLFLAHKTGLDVDVVIKRVKPDKKGRINEQKEARIMTALRHQYLPRIFDQKLGSDGYRYTVMEYIPGETLKSYVSKRGSLDQRQTFHWVRQLLQVTAYMHGLKPKAIIHSDLKPDNVMITPAGDICVIDFNASLEMEDREEEMTAIGATAGFAAPEQYHFPLKNYQPTHPLYNYIRAAQNAGSVSPRTDIYAIGALAYYMITGYVPRMWTDGVIPLERYDIRLGDAFRSVIEKAMQPDQKNRYADARSMLHALEHLPVLDTRYKKLMRAERITALIIGLGLAASVFLITLGIRDVRKDDSRAYLSLVSQAEDLRDQGLYEDSLELLTQAIAMNDRRAEAYLSAAAILYERGEYRQAIDLLENTDVAAGIGADKAAFEESQGQLFYILASCYYKEQDYSSALTNYQLAAELLPEETAYIRDLAICHARCGNEEMAGDAADRLEALGAPASDLSAVRGEIAFASGDYENARDRLLEAARSASDTEGSARAYEQAAMSCQMLGSETLSAQKEILREATDRFPVSGETIGVYRQYAQTCLALYDKEEDNSSLEDALPVFERIRSAALFTLDDGLDEARFLQELRRFSQAEEKLLELKDRYPNNYRIPMRLALLTAYAEGEKESSQRDYRKTGAYWRDAEALYNGTPDTEMDQLNVLVGELQAGGWDL
ncbi:MAG: protein kinase [Lachnospiraceae bacterium]|nr:protein kinase [Lachnospiraceae bacterium]